MSKCLAGAEQNVFPRVTNVPLITDVAGLFWTFLDFSIVLRSRLKSLNVSDFSGFFLVLPDRIELSTSPLPRECSTTELRQQDRGPVARHGAAEPATRADAVQGLDVAADDPKL